MSMETQNKKDTPMELSDENLKEIQNKIETVFRGRVEMIHAYATEEEYLKAQAEFFSGAMAAMVALGVENGQAMPPRWVIPAMVGEKILK